MSFTYTRSHCAVQCWTIKGSGVCTGGKDSEIVAETFGQDKGQS